MERLIGSTISGHGNAIVSHSAGVAIGAATLYARG
jgi:hypothetical protein